jgi:hypothetical protein
MTDDIVLVVIVITDTMVLVVMTCHGIGYYERTAMVLVVLVLANVMVKLSWCVSDNTVVLTMLSW